MALSPGRILESAPVLLLTQASGQEDAIRQVTAGWDGHPSIPGPLESIIHSVLEREAVMTTALPNGIAFPHARTALVTAPVLAVGRFDNPVKFGEVPVWLVIAVATPPGQTMEHLQLLSWLARRCGEGAGMGRMREASSSDELRAAFNG